jgi:DnaJ-domain-containing protein 1
MGWIEFTVIIVCGLVGFILMNSVIDSRRARATNEEPLGDDRNSNKRSKTTPDSRSWWDILNVERDATPEKIKGAFRKEISKYHPDRVEGLGIELRELADQKAKEVNQAYTLAKQERRFN